MTVSTTSRCRTHSFPSRRQAVLPPSLSMQKRTGISSRMRTGLIRSPSTRMRMARPSRQTTMSSVILSTTLLILIRRRRYLHGLLRTNFRAKPEKLPLHSQPKPQAAAVSLSLLSYAETTGSSSGSVRVLLKLYPQPARKLSKVRTEKLIR